jgi:hypothetical protein
MQLTCRRNICATDALHDGQEVSAKNCQEDLGHLLAACMSWLMLRQAGCDYVATLACWRVSVLGALD